LKPSKCFRAETFASFDFGKDYTFLKARKCFDAETFASFDLGEETDLETQQTKAGPKIQEFL